MTDTKKAPRPWLQPKQYVALKLLSEGPMTRAAIKGAHNEGGRIRLTPYEHLVRKGYAMFDHMAPQPYWVITPAGRQKLAAVHAMPKLPKYAGGAEPIYKRKPKVQQEVLALPAPLEARETGTESSTSGTVVESVLLTPLPVRCAVELMVSLQVPVTMLLDDRGLDAQAIADAVCARLARERCHAFLAGSRIKRVLSDAGNLLVEELRA